MYGPIHKARSAGWPAGLARIDDRDFKVAIDQAKADVAAAQATVASKQAQLEVQEAVIAAAKATIDVDNAAKTFAGQENKRYTDLAATGFGSVQNAQNAQARDAGAEAAIARDTANLISARKQVDLLKAEIAQAVAGTRSASPRPLLYPPVMMTCEGEHSMPRAMARWAAISRRSSSSPRGSG